MPLDAKRYKVKFDHQTLTFDETLPEGLQDLIKPEEYDAILRKINTELNQEALEACRKMKNIGTVYGPLSLAFIGLLLTFNMARRARRCRKALRTFFKNVEDLLNEWNKKTFLRRKIDWRLVQDKKYIRGRDVANPFFAYRIDILHKLGRRRGREGFEGSSGGDSGAGVASRTDSITLPSNVKFEGSVGAGASNIGEETGGSQNQRGSISSLKRVSFTDDLLKDFKASSDDNEGSKGAVVAGAAAVGAAALLSTSDDNPDQVADKRASRQRKRVSFTSENLRDDESDSAILAKTKREEDVGEEDDDDDDLMIVSSTPIASSLPNRSSQLKQESQAVQEEEDDDDEIFVKRPE